MARRWRSRASDLRVAALVVLSGVATWSLLASTLHLVDVRLPVFVLGALVASPGWVILGLAARNRGTPGWWLTFGVLWAVGPAAWLSNIGEGRLTELATGLSLTAPALHGFAADWIAPVVEETAKLLGILVVLGAAWRAGTRRSIALGAAIGGFIGLWFAIGEVAQHMVAIVNNVGYQDLDGTFVIDPTFVRLSLEAELANRFFFLGLTNHALFSALAGVAAVRASQGMRATGVLWFLVAVTAHAAYNGLGAPLVVALHAPLIALTQPHQTGDLGFMIAVGLAGAIAFVVVNGWAAVLLIRALRRGPEPGATGAGGRPTSTSALTSPELVT